MPTTAIRVDSDKALRYLKQLRATTERWGRSRTTIVSDLPYTFGIETGRTRRGRLARRVGGAYMMRRGLEDAKPRIKPIIVKAFERGGPSDVPLQEANIGRMVIASIRKYTPKVSGKLRDSFRAEVR